eukprot:1158144-Pelagomonas_calceolata.AAC.3
MRSPRASWPPKRDSEETWRLCREQNASLYVLCIPKNGRHRTHNVVTKNGRHRTHNVVPKNGRHHSSKLHQQTAADTATSALAIRRLNMREDQGQ